MIKPSCRSRSEVGLIDEKRRQNCPMFRFRYTILFVMVDISRPGTFQIFFFGTNQCLWDWGGPFLRRENRKTLPLRGRKRPISWYWEQVWPPNLCLATPYSAKTIAFPFFFLNSLEYVLPAISKNLLFIGYDQGTMTGVGWCALTHSFLTRHRQWLRKWIT